MEKNNFNELLGTQEFMRCKKYIEAALKYTGGTHDLVDIYEGLYKGTMQLWPMENSCLVTEIITYPRKKVLNVFLGAGDLTEILEMHDSVISWAQAQGCEALNMTGRFGWKKPLAKYGWKPLHSSYVKEIK
tara:strand:- start:848 stop:1240 length:393 start_codon:yes stop_codon:yes gene_type:complete